MSAVLDVEEAKDQSGSCKAESVQEPTTKMDIGDEAPSTSADASMEHIGGQEPEVFKEPDNKGKSPIKEDNSSNKEDSPDVSGSSDVVSGTPQKPNSRRQSFITLEKYVEGKPASPISASRFTGPLAKNSQGQETPKSQGSIAHSPDTSQAENSQEVFMETDVSQNHVEGSPGEDLKEIKDVAKDLKPSSERPSESTEEEDVIPDTQTKMQKEDLACGVGTLQKDDMAKTMSEEESDVFADSQSESSSPANPRRSGRQRTKPVRPGEESDEQEGKNKTRGRRAASNDKNISVSKESTYSSPVDTDSQSKGRRRSKIVEVENVDTVKVRKGMRSDIDNSQSDSQSVAGDSQTQGRRRSQAELLVASQNSLLLNSQTQERPMRRTRSLQDADSQQLSNEAEVDGQSQGRPVRKTRRSETAKLQNESQSQSQTDSEQLGSQADGGVRGKRRRKVVSEENESKNSSQNAQVENFDESQESSQGRIRSKTRRSAQLLSASAENSDSNASEAGDEGQKPKKRGRRLYSMNAALTQSPQSIAQTSENAQKSQEHAGGSEDVQSTQMPNSPTPQQSPVKNNSFVSDDQMPCDEEKTLNEEKIAKQEEVMVTPKEDEDMQEEPKLAEKSKEAAQMVPITPSSLCIEEHKDADVMMDDVKSDDQLEHSPASQTKHGKLENTDMVEVNISNERIDSSSEVVMSNSKGTDSQTEPSVTDGMAKTSCPVHSRGSRGRPRLKGCICHLGVKTDAVNQSESQASQENKTHSADINQLQPHSEEVTSEEVKAVENENGLPDSNVSETEPDDSSATSLPVESSHKSSDAVVEVAALLSDPTEQDGGEHAVPEDLQEELKTEEPSTVLGVSEVVGIEEEPLEEKASAEPVEAQILCKQEEPLEESTVSHTTETLEVQDVTNDDEEEDGVAPLVDDPKSVVTEEEEVQMDNRDQMLGQTENHSELPVETTEPLQSAEEKDMCLDSPPKQKCLDALSGEAEMGQSPSSGRTRGVWSPSASPSTSILKKGQKRPCEEDSPSPLLKVMHNLVGFRWIAKIHFQLLMSSVNDFTILYLSVPAGVLC